MKLSIVVTICILATSGILPAQDAPIKVAEDTAKSAAVTKVVPDYPIIAKQMKLIGKVELSAVIGLDGTVEKTDVVSGNPLLTGAAAAALKKWKFTPFSAEGKPVKAQTTINFEFKM